MKAALNTSPATFSLLISVAVIGCSPTSSDGPFGPAKETPLLSQFAGRWVFDLERTLAAQKAAGATEEEIAQLRGVHKVLGKLHPDLTFKGDVAVGKGMLTSEYRFFGMHQHGAKVCGKAWHHEDRFDPGDMSKCYVRLSVIDGRLHLEVNMLEELPDLNDPDLLSTPAVEGDVSKCDADKQNPEHRMTYVFLRGG